MTLETAWRIVAPFLFLGAFILAVKVIGSIFDDFEDARKLDDEGGFIDPWRK